MTGGTAGSFAALASGQVAGAVLTPPFDDKAVTKGFKKFMLIGDLLDIPTSGLITSRAEVANHRDRVQKTIVALFDAIAWIRTNRSETSKMIAEKFKITPAAAESCARLSRHSAPGTPDSRRSRCAEVRRFFYVARSEIETANLAPLRL